MMTVSIERIKTLAAEAASWFVQRGRIENPEDRYVTLKDEHPQWVQDMMFAAHHNGKLLPDDYRYLMVSGSLDIIEESDAERPDLFEDHVEESILVSSDLPHGELLDWIGSNIQRTAYLDDALEIIEVTNSSEWFTALMLAYSCEYREVFDQVVEFLSGRVEEE